MKPVTYNRSSRMLAVITGATSGIGKAYAEYFAANGYDLLITGRRNEVMRCVASELRSRYNVNIDVVIADLSVHKDVSLLLQIIGKKKNIGVLINNAGYGLENKFMEDKLKHQMAMLKVHVNVPLMLMHKVLPQMIKNNNGIIINVSSLAVFTPTSGNAMYTGSKAFLKSFTESLHMDVRNFGIKVQCLCPGFTYSDFHRNHTPSWIISGQGLWHWMKPSEVVDYSITCLYRGQVVCVPGFMNRTAGFLAAVMPRNLYYMIAVKATKGSEKINPVMSPLRSFGERLSAGMLFSDRNMQN